jgi:tetratricopeptide (TPR) repeat protein
LHLGLQLAEALAFIHSLGVCHCDLKPSNVLLTPDGQPMLLDFNLSFREQPVDQRLGGTFPYMSPEFLRAMDSKRKGFPSQIDARSDLFSLGVMLCELLLGDHPFGPIEKKDTLEDLRKYLLDQQQKRARPKWSNNPRVNRRISRLLDRCLSFRPEDRPQSAAELVDGLRKCLSRPQRLRRWAYLHARLLVASTLVSLLAASLGGYWLVPKEPYSVRQFHKGMDLFHLGRYSEAIACFNQVDLLDPKNANVQFARGRTFQRLGQFDAAGAAYLAADELRPEGKAKALQAYCSGQLDEHRRAIAQNNAAIEDGLQTAQVFNNRGYSYLKLGQLENAEKDFKKAAELDENLQAPHFNLALVELKRAFKAPETQSACQRGIVEINKALEIGPDYADLHYFKAFLYAKALTQDKSMKRSALDCLEKAITSGFPSNKIDMTCFAELTQEPRFLKLFQTPPPQVEAPRAPRLLDPVRE